MTESTKPAQCRDEEWNLARDCGLMAATPGTNAFDTALARFASGVRDGAAQMLAGFQQRVQPWMLECFGAEIAADGMERNHRFLEESLELVQACGCTRSEAHQLVDYVFSRHVGQKDQEVGGVMVTLAALCLAQSLDMHAAGDTELARVWQKIEQIRAKQAAKPKHSPLPEHVSAGNRREGWQPIETAPEGQLVVVLWFDKTDPENTQRHDFDFKGDGVWHIHNENYEHYLCVGGSMGPGPSERAPYTHWMPLPAAPAHGEPGALEQGDAL